ncbi:MAG: SAM-dependent methyltransferase [Kiritimatiellae bacterium]|nr:SAM-dependent methyltransferase [Kiritimatiellia bacterium]
MDQTRYRPEMHEALAEISALAFDTPDFREASFRFAAPIGPGDNAALALRPVEIGGEPMWQIVRGGDAANRSRGQAKKLLWELANSANILAEAHASASDGTALHFRTTRKGHVLLQRVRATAAKAASSAHDRDKDHALKRFDSSRLLVALGLAGPDGEVKPSMQGKYRQVNQFIAHVEAALDELPPRKDETAPLNVVDCGCGKAYLSFAAKAYLEAVRGVKVELSGVDLKESVIAACRRTAEVLGCAGTAAFHACDIAAFKPETRPDVVLSLHACDTATDEAIAFGVERGARAIICAPCCQHELQKTLDPKLSPHQALLRNGILRERFADILTDAFRAQILRVMGYRATVAEFVDAEATARNVVIRAVRVSRPGTGTAVADYWDLARAWRVTPWLATRLKLQEP